MRQQQTQLAYDRRGAGVATVLILGAALVGACGGGSDGDGACSAQALRDALAAAVSGDAVPLGACRIEGAFTVPAGVTLAGAGRSETVLVAPPDGIALTLTPGEPPTAVRGLSIASPDGCAAIVARGDGSGRVAIEDVAVAAERGIGIGLEGLAGAALNAVELQGAIAPEDADQTAPPLPPYSCETAVPATIGLVARQVAAAQLDGVTASGFAAFGALLVDGGATWTGGGVADGVGTGLEVWGGTAVLEDVAIERVRDGLAPIESYGAVFAGDADVETRRLAVRDGDSAGVLCDSARTAHEDPQVTGNGFAGFWAQDVASFAVSGAASLVSGNGFAGIALVDATGAVLRDARIEGTVEKLGLTGPTAAVRAGDGLHLVRSAVELADLSIVDNPRVGLLLELGGASTADLAVRLEGVDVDASGDALGAIAQNGEVLPGWDDGVTRQGATAGNDALFADVLGVASGVGPSCIPSPGPLSDEGLRVLLMED